MVIIFHSLDRTNIGPQVELAKEAIYGPAMAISKIMELTSAVQLSPSRSQSVTASWIHKVEIEIS